MALIDLVSFRTLQKLQDHLALSHGVSLNLLDPMSLTPITAFSNRSNLYEKLALPAGSDCDFLSVKERGGFSDKPYFFTCRAGFLNFCLPLFHEGHILAYLIGGEVRKADFDFKDLEVRAQKLNLAVDNYLENYLSVPLFSQEKLEQAAQTVRFVLQLFISFSVDRSAEKKRADQLHELNLNLEKNLLERSKRIDVITDDYQTVVENLPDIVYCVNDKDIFISLNNAVELILGYRKQELLGKSFLTIIHPSDIERLKKAFFEAVDGKKTLNNLIFKVQTKKGEMKYLSLNSRRTFTAEGKLIKIDGTMRDVTEQQRLSQKLFHSEEKYKNLIDNPMLRSPKLPLISRKLF